ncbi:MAG: G8 domain-containing protein [Pseudomonadota bacterium]
MPKHTLTRLGFVYVAFLALSLAACGSDGPSLVDPTSDSDGPTGSGGGGGGSTGGGTGSTPHHCSVTPDFVDLSLMTHIAAQSGNWNSTETWNGDLPGTGAIVQIPEGIEVIVASVNDTRLETIRVDGTLKFATDTNTELKLDTLFSSCTGLLEIGTANQPVAANVSARIVFIDDGPVTDPKLLSRGAILAGRTTIHGTPKTHRATIAPHAIAGDSVLNLGITPTGWQLNDQLIITGTIANNPESDEIRYIQQLSGPQVTLDMPLDLNHNAPKPDLNVYVANSSRNVEFVSENPTVAHRGHIMFMSLEVNVQNARFTELGRTDKTRPLDDVEFAFHEDSNGDDAPATADVVTIGGSNVRGRYAVHFHRAGISPSSLPALISGSVVFNGPGWGFVNHSSNVDFVDNVSYGLQGAGFYTETGDETGSMRGNIAIRSVNSAFALDDQGAIDPDLGAGRMDFGNDGDGFWLTGNRVSLINNVSAGASAHGIIYWTDGLMEPDASPATRSTVSVANLTNGNLIPNRESIPVWWAPLAESRGNESYGATVGFRSRYIHAKTYLGRDEQSDFHRSPPQAYIDTLDPRIEDLTVWGSRDGVLLNYNERMTLMNARIVGFGRDTSKFSFNPGTAKSGIGFDISNESTDGPGKAVNVGVEGFGVGFATPVNGTWKIEGLTMAQNGLDMLIIEPESKTTEIQFRNVQYGSFEVYENETVTELPDHITVIE